MQIVFSLNMLTMTENYIRTMKAKLLNGSYIVLLHSEITQLYVLCMWICLDVPVLKRVKYSIKQ